MDIAEVQHAVAEQFVTTGVATPPWPDPHPYGAAPLEQEYSRCLNPDRYRIVGARAYAWVRALTVSGLASTEEVNDPSAVWRDLPTVRFDYAIRLTPSRAATVPVLLAFASFDGTPDALVTVGAGDPAVPLARVPDCGCDACDHGSDELLEELDEYMTAAVSGSLVHIASKRLTIVATDSDCSASTKGKGVRAHEKERMLNEARDGRSPHRVVQGAPWT